MVSFFFEITVLLLNLYTLHEQMCLNCMPNNLINFHFIKPQLTFALVIAFVAFEFCLYFRIQLCLAMIWVLFSFIDCELLFLHSIFSLNWFYPFLNFQFKVMLCAKYLKSFIKLNLQYNFSLIKSFGASMLKFYSILVSFYENLFS